MSSERIHYGESRQAMKLKMSDGDDRVCAVIDALIERIDNVFKGNDLGPWFCAFQLDDLGIYGKDIWTLYDQVCRGNIDAVITILVGEYHGHISANDVRAAIAGDGQLNPPSLARRIWVSGGRLSVNLAGHKMAGAIDDPGSYKSAALR